MTLRAPYQPSLLAGASFAALDPEINNIGIHGVNDERRWYYPHGPPPNHRWVRQGLRMREQGESPVMLENIGFTGYFAGPAVHIIDVFALADPLLARLPSQSEWRIGHFQLTVPAGYFESVKSRRNLIVDPGIAAYYEQLHLVTSGPIWNVARWYAIVRLNLLATGRVALSFKEFVAITADRAMLSPAEEIVRTR